VDDPSPDEYRRIFIREAALHNFSGADVAVEHLLARWYTDGRPMRGCHPRDILDAVGDLSRHAGQGPLELTDELIDEACITYFL
jgi:hypothetical protein